MVGVSGIFWGYIVGTLWPNFMSAANPGPMFMGVCGIIASFGVAYIAYRGVVGSTGVSIAINVIQISALILFSFMALAYRMNHAPGSTGLQWDATSGASYNFQFKTEKTTANGQTTDTIVRDSNGVPQPLLDAQGKPVHYQVTYPAADGSRHYASHPNAKSLIAPHTSA